MYKKIIIFSLFLLTLAFVAYNSFAPSVATLSPHVSHFEWGKIIVGSTEFKDCRLWPNHQEEWDWNKTNTRHVPGIQISDLSDFIDEVDVIILSEGMEGVLKIKPETLTYLQERKKEVHCARTPQAIELYNTLVKNGVKVGALLHLTC